MAGKLLVGVDYGTDSVRAVLIHVDNGVKVAETAVGYSRWSKELYCDPISAQYRQHPLDYIEGLEAAINGVLQVAGAGTGNQVSALAIDTTGSTPCPVNAEGVPLALLESFAEDPDGMFHLWKDHTAVHEAVEINAAFSSAAVDYTQYQGIYSSEWFWAKILHTIRKNSAIRHAAYTWVEHCDWIAGLLIGNIRPETLFHSMCAAGHKALWHSSFHGLPDEDCLASLDPFLKDVAKRYGRTPVPAGTCLGKITKEWASRLHLSPDTIIGMGSFDAHAGGVGAGVARGTMIKVVGTSTVDLLVEKAEVLAGKDLRAYCGQAEDSIVPGYIGLEMGQPAFGDAYAWFKNLLLWPLKEGRLPKDQWHSWQGEEILHWLEKHLLERLGEEAANKIKEDTVALDWFNGRRYPRLNEKVKAAMSGLSLGSDAVSVYCAIVKGTVFGSRHIFDELQKQGLQIERLIVVGGIAKKSPFVMQMLADVMNLPIMVCQEEQVCAKGSAIYAAVAARHFRSVEEAQRAYCESYQPAFLPDTQRHEMYEAMYLKYLALGNAVEFALA